MPATETAEQFVFETLEEMIRAGKREGLKRFKVKMKSRFYWVLAKGPVDAAKRVADSLIQSVDPVTVDDVEVLVNTIDAGKE